jgi:type II secretory pathway component GspD/PulD (secretin)
MDRIGLSVAVLLGLVIGAASAADSGQPKPALTAQPDSIGEAKKSAWWLAPASPDPWAAEAPAWGSSTKSAAPVPVVPSQDGERRHTRLVCGLKAVPASDLANTIKELLRAEAQSRPGDASRSVVIVADPISNSLVLSGSPEVVGEVQRLVEQLDRPAMMVRLEFLLVRLPATSKPEGKGRVETRDPNALPEQSEILARGELTTLSNQKARLQVGRNEGRISGSNVTQRGTAVNTISYVNVGTILSMTPRVAADRTVALEVELTDARPGPIEEGTPISVPSQGEPTRVPNEEMFTTQTTVQIADGKTATVAGMVQGAKSPKRYMLLLTPHVVSMSGQAANGGAKPQQEPAKE